MILRLLATMNIGASGRNRFKPITGQCCYGILRFTTEDVVPGDEPEDCCLNPKAHSLLSTLMGSSPDEDMTCIAQRPQTLLDIEALQSNLFTDQEISSALEYVNRIRKIISKTSISLNDDKQEGLSVFRVIDQIGAHTKGGNLFDSNDFVEVQVLLSAHAFITSIMLEYFDSIDLNSFLGIFNLDSDTFEIKLENEDFITGLDEYLTCGQWAIWEPHASSITDIDALIEKYGNLPFRITEIKNQDFRNGQRLGKQHVVVEFPANWERLIVDSACIRRIW